MKRIKLGITVLTLFTLVAALLLVGVPGRRTLRQKREQRREQPSLKVHRPSPYLLEKFFASLPASPSETKIAAIDIDPVIPPSPTPACRPPCSTVDIVCDATRCGAGTVGCIGRSDCELNISPAQCESLGVGEGPYGQPFQPPANVTVDSANAYCTLMHELTHARQNTCNTSECQQEGPAYADGSACMGSIANSVCMEDADSQLCEDLRWHQCANQSMAALQNCMASNAGCGCGGCQSSCSSTMDSCMASHGLSANNTSTLCNNLLCSECGTGSGCE